MSDYDFNQLLNSCDDSQLTQLCNNFGVQLFNRKPKDAIKDLYDWNDAGVKGRILSMLKSLSERNANVNLPGPSMGKAHDANSHVNKITAGMRGGLR